jgi:hypothetical protein
LDRKLYFEIVKFKVTLFTTIVGGGMYLFFNKESVVDVVGEPIFYGIVMVVVGYGVFGFVLNMLKLRKIEESVK